jgi:spore germination protein YaaH
MQGSRHFAFATAVAIVLVVAAPGSAPATASTHKTATTAHPQKEVFGFALASSLANPSFGYPSWNFDLLSTVAFFGLHVDTAGHFVGDAGWNTWNSADLTNLLSVAHQHGTKVVLTVILQDFSPNTPSMCSGLQHADATVGQTVQEVKAKGVDGVNIDYEGLDGSCGMGDPYWSQHAMTAFAQKMRAGLGSSYYLSVDTYAAAASDGYGFFDVAGLAQYVDSFFVMAYDLEYSNYRRAPASCSSFCLGPTAPLTAYYYNDSDVTSQYVAVVGAGKVILGVPYYGRKSCVGGAVPNAYPTSSVVADSYLDASTEASDPAVRAGSFAAHRETNSSGAERWDTWYNTTLNCTRELYWDDAVSLGKKYDLVNAASLRGAGIWNLNYGGGAPELWSQLSSHFAATCGPATLSAGAASPQPTGVHVTFSSTTSVCTAPQWRFWVQPPGGAWQVQQDYSSNRFFAWSQSVSGTYQIEVDVRSSPTVSYDSVARVTYVLNGCFAATLSSDRPSPQRTGVTVALNASATCPGTAEYRFWIQPPGGAWSMVRDYSTSASYAWNTTGRAAGAYGLEVDVRNQGSTATYEAVGRGTFSLDPPCAKPTLALSPGSPQPVGAAVVLTSTTATCPQPLWRFWIQPPGGGWTVVQDYSSTRTYTWSTAGKAAGTYNVEVDVRDASTTDSYDAVTQLATVLGTCGGARLTTDKGSPQPPGSSIGLTAGASCPGTAQYRFWTLTPGGRWTVVQDYSAASAFTWSTAGKPNGLYGLEVDVRDQGSTASYESVANLNFLVDACSAARLSTDRPSPQPPGTTVTLTGSATCLGTPKYRFWVKPPGGGWTVVQDYGSSSTFSWKTIGMPAGAYGLEVDVRDQGSTASYETVANLTFNLT